MGPVQNCLPHYTARRADPGANPRHRYRYQRDRLLCRNAFALSRRSRSGCGVVDGRGKGYDPSLSADQRSQSWYGNRIRRVQDRRAAAVSGPSPRDVSLQLLNRAPEPKVTKSAQLEKLFTKLSPDAGHSASSERDLERRLLHAFSCILRCARTCKGTNFPQLDFLSSTLELQCAEHPILDPHTGPPLHERFH